MRRKRIIDEGEGGRSEAGFMASYTPRPRYSVLKYRHLIFEGRCSATRTIKDKEKVDGTVRIALYYQMISASASASATVIEHGPQFKPSGERTAVHGHPPAIGKRHTRVICEEYLFLKYPILTDRRPTSTNSVFPKLVFQRFW